MSKRNILISLGIALGVLTLAPTYTYVRKEVANTWGAIQTFPYGITLTSTTQTINTLGVHLRYDADTSCWQEWKDGALGWQLCGNRVIMPDCASDHPSLEFGGFCKDQTSGRIIMNIGAGGTVYLTGTSL